MAMADVEAAVRPCLYRALRRFDDAMDALVPPPPRVLTYEEKWAQIGALSKHLVTSLAEAIPRLNAAATVLLLGTPEQRRMVEQAMRRRDE